MQGLWFAGLGAGAALLATFMLAKLRRWTRKRARRHLQHAAGQAEHDAQQLLADHGYHIEQVHPRRAITVQCDDAPLHFNLRADLLVSKGGRHFVADVKNGAVVADLRHGPTRRQLLEYALAYPCDGVLLVDMHRRRIQRVGFDWAGAAKAPTAYGPLLLVAVLLIAFALLVIAGR